MSKNAGGVYGNKFNVYAVALNDLLNGVGGTFLTALPAAIPPWGKLIIDLPWGFELPDSNSGRPGYMLTGYKITGVNEVTRRLNEDWEAIGTRRAPGMACSPNSISIAFWLGTEEEFEAADTDAVSTYVSSFHYGIPANIVIKKVYSPIWRQMCQCICEEEQWFWSCNQDRFGRLQTSQTDMEFTHTWRLLTSPLNQGNIEGLFYPPGAINENGMPTSTSPISKRGTRIDDIDNPPWS